MTMVRTYFCTNDNDNNDINSKNKNNNIVSAIAPCFVSDTRTIRFVTMLL